MADILIIVCLAYAVTVYLRYLQWLSDDANFDPYTPFNMWGS